MKSPEFDRVTCGECNKVYTSDQVKIEWRGNDAEWKCPACGTIHDGFSEGNNRLVFKKRGPRP